MPPRPAPRTINGTAVREIRQTLGMTQTALAEAAGAHPVTINHIEAGRKAASAAMQRAIADALGVSLATITTPRQAAA